jgi:transposase
MSEVFWLSDDQWVRLAPLLPNKSRGVKRVDDRRVISGIVHVLRSGGRWIDAPASYGPRKTLYNRFVRWAAKGIWTDLFLTLTVAGGPPAELLLDSTHVRAHRSATGGKGGSTIRRSASAAAQAPRADGRRWPSLSIPAHTGSGSRLSGGRNPAQTLAVGLSDHSRPGLRHRRDPMPDRGPRRGPEHPAQAHTALEGVLQPGPLPRSLRDRAHVLPPQGLEAHRHTLRQAHHQLPRRRPDRRLLVVSPDPR